jgi:outer membrane lipoprotein-sorting protein
VFVLCLFFVVAVLSSCATRTDYVEPGKDPGELMDRIDQYNRMVRSVDARALVVFKDGEKQYSFRATLLAEGNGNKLRLTLSDFVFKKPLVSIVKNENVFTAIVYVKKQYIQEPYEELDVVEVTGLRIQKEILLATLMGKVYVDGGPSVLTSPDASTLIIDCHEGEREVVSFDSRMLPSEVTYARDYRKYRTVFHEYMLVDGVYYPKKLSIVYEDQELTANFSDVRVNRSLDSATFQLDDEELGNFERKRLN